MIDGATGRPPRSITPIRGWARASVILKTDITVKQLTLTFVQVRPAPPNNQQTVRTIRPDSPRRQHGVCHYRKARSPVRSPAPGV